MWTTEKNIEQEDVRVRRTRKKQECMLDNNVQDVLMCGENPAHTKKKRVAARYVRKKRGGVRKTCACNKSGAA